MRDGEKTVMAERGFDRLIKLRAAMRATQALYQEAEAPRVERLFALQIEGWLDALAVGLDGYVENSVQKEELENALTELKSSSGD